LGLNAHLTGFTLQDDIAAMTCTLHSRGRAAMGSDIPPFDRPGYAKTPKQIIVSERVRCVPAQFS